MADLNHDGLDDVTGWAVGVVQDPTSPTGFRYNGIPVYSNGAAFTGSTVLAGTQIPIDAEQIRASQATTATNAARQAADAAYQQGQLSLGREGNAIQAQASAQRHAEAMAQYALQQAIAERQYQVDAAKFGLDVANFNWQKNKAAADMQLQKNLFGVQSKQFELSQAEFNANQRQQKEMARQNILKMLADRRGPQDAFGYNNLLNGLNAPNPMKSTTIDPFAGLADLYKESNIASPAWTDPTMDTTPYAGSLPSSISLPSFGAAGGNSAAAAAGGGGGGGGGTPGVTSSSQLPPPSPQSQYAPTNPPATNITGEAANPANQYSGVPYNQVSYLQPGQFALVTTGTAGPSALSDYTNNYEVFQNPTTKWTDASIPGGTAIWLKKLAIGGDVYTQDKTQIPVSEPASGVRVTPVPNQNGVMMPANGAQAEADKRATYGQQETPPSQVSLAQDPRTVYGQNPPPQPAQRYIAPVDNYVPPETTQPVTEGPPIDWQALRAQKLAWVDARPGVPMPTPMPETALRPDWQGPAPTPVVTPDQTDVTLGRELAPQPSPQPAQQPDMTYRDALMAKIQQMQAAGIAVPDWLRQMFPDLFVPGMAHGGNVMSGAGDRMGYKGRSADIVRPGEAAAVVGDRTGRKPTGHEEIAVARDDAQGQPYLHVIPHERAMQIMHQVRMAHAASGGTYGTGTGNFGYTGGTYGTDLNIGSGGGYGVAPIVVNQYSPEVLGNLPAYLKLTGRAPSRAFGGFGATVSNPAIGLYDVPTQFSMQRWNMLAPSEQKLMSSLYEQGLGLDLNDMLTAAERAAPEGRARIGYAAAMGPSTYGSRG